MQVIRAEAGRKQAPSRCQAKLDTFSSILCISSYNSGGKVHERSKLHQHTAQHTVQHTAQHTAQLFYFPSLAVVLSAIVFGFFLRSPRGFNVGSSAPRSQQPAAAAGFACFDLDPPSTQGLCLISLFVFGFTSPSGCRGRAMLLACRQRAMSAGLCLMAFHSCMFFLIVGYNARRV